MVARVPFVSAARYAVTSITFEDPMKHAWRWTPERGLEQLIGALPAVDTMGSSAGD